MTKKYFMPALAVLSLLALLVLSACGNKTEENNNHVAETPVAEISPELPAGAVVGGNPGEYAPFFKLENIAGGSLTMASLRGKVVLIDFWDTWCPPCKKALPGLEAISKDYPDDLVVVGIAFGRDGKAKVQQYVAQNHLTFPMVLSDKKFKIAADFGGVKSIPSTFLVDRKGVIVKKWVGGHSREEYEDAIKKVLGS